jgi:hypothetical protein
MNKIDKQITNFINLSMKNRKKEGNDKLSRYHEIGLNKIYFTIYLYNVF